MKRLSLLLAAALIALGASSYLISPSTILVNPSTNLQAAVNSFATTGRGGVIALSPGTYTMAAPLTLPAYPPISIVGSGNFQTLLDFSSLPADSSCIVCLSGSVTLSDFSLKGQGTTTGAGNGILLRSGPYNADNSILRNLQVYNCPASALYIAGVGDASYLGAVYPAAFSEVENCFMFSTYGATNTTYPLVYIGANALLWKFTGDTFRGGAKQGVVVGGPDNGTDGLYFDKCAFGANDQSTKEFVVLNGCRQVSIRDGWFEGNNSSVEDTSYYKLLIQPSTKPGSRGGNTGIGISDCFFVTGWHHLRAIKVTGTAGSMHDDGIRITNCWGITDSTTYDQKNSIYVGVGANHIGVYGGGVRNQAALPVTAHWGIVSLQRANTVPPAADSLTVSTN